jgi:hypothetical protein
VPADAVEVAALDEDEWTAVLGSWTIVDASARVDVVNTTAPTFLVTGTESADYTQRARLDIGSLTSGLVFRYRDPANYWALGGVPSLGVWRVYKVLDGQEVEVGLFEEPICCSPGVLMSVSTAGDGVVVVSVDSLLLLDIHDPEFADARHTGLYALGDDATDAHFSAVELIDRGPDRSPVVARHVVGG